MKVILAALVVAALAVPALASASSASESNPKPKLKPTPAWATEAKLQSVLERATFGKLVRFPPNRVDRLYGQRPVPEPEYGLECQVKGAHPSGLPLDHHRVPAVAARSHLHRGHAQRRVQRRVDAGRERVHEAVRQLRVPHEGVPTLASVGRDPLRHRHAREMQMSSDEGTESES